jgi:hypothetical protein
MIVIRLRGRLFSCQLPEPGASNPGYQKKRKPPCRLEEFRHQLQAVSSLLTSPSGTLDDGEFLIWSFDSTGGGGSAAREDSGGNPGARLRISTSAPSGTNTVTAIKDDFTTNIPFEGDTFTFSVDFLSGEGAAGDGQSAFAPRAAGK